MKASSPTASPNAGFVQQLRLFYKMGWKIDAQHEQFKMYRLRLAADKVRKGRERSHSSCRTLDNNVNYWTIMICHP